MTDRELLELAAKAAGWTGWRSKHGYWNVTSPDGESSTKCHGWASYDQYTGDKLNDPTFADAIAETNWNPLTDDGDALRLAVKLKIDITQFSEGVRADSAGTDDYYVPHDQDPYEATRRAIIRAAAEIGKAMK